MAANRYAWALVFVVCLALGACAGLEPLPEGVDGEWKARRPGSGDEIRLDLYLGPMGSRDTVNRRMWLDLGELTGLDESAFRGSEPFTFRLERDAGTFHFEGVTQRRPRGSFRFEASAEYLDRIAQIGVTEVEQDVLLLLALHGVSEGLVEALLAGGYRDTDGDALLRLEFYGLRPDWIASMSRLAGPPSFDELISLRRSGVGTRHVDAWVEADLQDLPVDGLLRLYVHGFKAANAAVYRELGFDDVDAWLTFHRNGVPADLIVAIVESGGPELDVSGVVGLYRQGVGPGDVREAAGLIDAGFDWDALVYMWRHGVSTDYAETLIEIGWDADPESLVRLRENDIDARFLERLGEAGFDDLDVDEIVEARRAGLDRWLERQQD